MLVLVVSFGGVCDGSSDIIFLMLISELFRFTILLLGSIISISRLKVVKIFHCQTLTYVHFD